MEGILIVNKPKNLTSRDVVNKLNHIFSMKRIGHTGTLDPMATGVLVICLGKYTKLVDELTSLDKEYIAEITLGIKTDTGDITGNIIENKEYNVTKEDILNVFNNFLGTYEQTVPAYSAVKIKGKKLYEYARNNIEVDLPKRKVEIYSLELLSFNDNKIIFKTRVSKGTYIRSLVEDISNKLNTVGTMSSLNRTRQGIFSLDNSYSIEEIEKGNYKLLSIKDIFDYPVIELSLDEYKKVSNGAKIDNLYNVNDKVVFTYQNIDVAIYKVDSNILKPHIML